MSCEPQSFEQGSVVVIVWIGCGEEFFAGEDGIGACHKAESLFDLRTFEAACGEANLGLRKGNAGSSDHAHHLKDGDRCAIFEWRALHRNEHIDGHRFGMNLSCGELVKQSNAIIDRFAHTDDAAAADADARLFHAPERAQAILISACGDDRAVVLRRSVEVVVVGSESRLLEAPGLAFVEHAQRAADFDVELAHLFHRLQHRIKLRTVAHLPPRSAEANATGALRLRCAGALQHLLLVHERFGIDSCFVARGLGAVLAVFGAAARLDGDERAELDFVALMPLSVDSGCLIDQIQQGACVETFEFFA